ncbi:MAG: hypothetical protein QM689_05140 [Oscillospiraceae bacterium]
MKTIVKTVLIATAVCTVFLTVKVVLELCSTKMKKYYPVSRADA